MDSEDTSRNEVARRYNLSEQGEWSKLLQHFDFSEGFGFIVLLVPDSDGAWLSRGALEAHLRTQGRRFHSLELATPADLRRLPETFLDTLSGEKADCLWVEAVAPDFKPDYAEWRGAWRHALAQLNAFRNPIREQFSETLLFVGAPWLQEVIREIAPDLWSVRTLVVRIEPVSRTAGQYAASSLGVSEDGSDPYFALEQAEKLRGVEGKELALATLLHRAGEGFGSQNNWHEAEKHLTEALHLKLRHSEVLVTLHELVKACYFTEMNERFRNLSEQMLSIAREVGDRFYEARGLNDLAIVDAISDKPQSAVEYYKQSLTLARELGDQRHEANVLDNIGTNYKNLGEPQRSIEYHEQSLNLARELGDKRHEAKVLTHIGNAYADLGESQRAVEYYKQALTLARETSDRRNEGLVLENLGIYYANSGEPQRALECFEQALVLHREIGSRRDESDVLSRMAWAYMSLGDTRRARDIGKQARALKGELDD